MIRHADWIVDVGPGAGEHGGEVLYSGPLDGPRQQVEASHTRRYLFGRPRRRQTARARRRKGWLRLRGVTRNNLDGLDVDVPARACSRP